MDHPPASQRWQPPRSLPFGCNLHANTSCVEVCSKQRKIQRNPSIRCRCKVRAVGVGSSALAGLPAQYTVLSRWLLQATELRSVTHLRSDDPSARLVLQRAIAVNDARLLRVVDPHVDVTKRQGPRAAHVESVEARPQPTMPPQCSQMALRTTQRTNSAATSAHTMKAAATTSCIARSTRLRPHSWNGTGSGPTVDQR
jgi:hypothetical protein